MHSYILIRATLITNRTSKIHTLLTSEDWSDCAEVKAICVYYKAIFYVDRFTASWQKVNCLIRKHIYILGIDYML